MSPRDDNDFGRFVYTVSVIGLVIVILGLAAIWYYFNYGGLPVPPVGSTHRGASLAPNQVMLYYTRDGRTLTGVVSELESGALSPNDRARAIATRLIEGRDAAFLRSPIPPGTKLNAVFVTGNLVIINLSKEFVNNLRPNVDDEMLAVYSLVNSLLFNIEGVDGVQILVEGERLPTLRGHVDLESPLIANPALTRAS
jgi:spore germination protein GerM